MTSHGSQQKINRSAALTATAAMAAIVIIMTAYILHIPIGVASGGYIHLGDAFIFLAASLLPQPYALMVGAIGAGVADLLTAPIWTLPSLIIKVLITLAFNAEGKLCSKHNALAALLALPITICGYYLAEVVLYGNWEAPLVSVPFNALQSVSSIAVFLALGAALDKMGIRTMINRMLYRH